MAILKQVVLADGVVRAEEIEAATRILKSAHSESRSASPDTDSKLETERMLEFDKKTLFSIAFALRRSMTRPQLDKLRENLLVVALSDGIFHTCEENLITLFDELTSSPAL